MINRFFKYLLKTIVVFCLSIWLILASCCSNRGKLQTSSKVTRVITAVIRPAIERPKINISGKLEAVDQAGLSFKIGGRIASVDKNVGDYVSKSTLMASLDQDEIKAQVSQAELLFEKMKRDFERVEQLYKEGAATREQYQDITTAFNNAEQQMKVTHYNLVHSRINAPFDGYIAMRRHEPGEMVAPGDPVFILVGDPSRLKVISGLSASYLSKIRIGDYAEISTPSLRRKVFEGQLKRIGMAADPVTGTFPVEIGVVNSGNLLRQGMVVNISLFTGEKKPLLMVPIGALVEADEDRGYVFIYNGLDSTVRKVPVMIGDFVGDQVIIEQGVKVGDEIVIEGAEYLQSGEKVEKIGFPDKSVGTAGKAEGRR